MILKLPPPPKLFQVVRGSDPWTSALNAAIAIKASRLCMYRVAKIMEDGVDRNDEELHRDYKLTGFRGSVDLVQHARKALSKAGLLVRTGKVRPSLLNKGLSEVWVASAALSGCVPSSPPARASKGQGPRRTRKPTQAEFVAFLDEVGYLVDVSGVTPSASFKASFTWMCSKHWKT